MVKGPRRGLCLAQSGSESGSEKDEAAALWFRILHDLQHLRCQDWHMLTRAQVLQDDDLRGLLHGIYVGVSGVLLKPVSGCFSLMSELCIGASGKIKAWGDESHKRPPISRVRPPRQFSALSSDMGGAAVASPESVYKSGYRAYDEAVPGRARGRSLDWSGKGPDLLSSAPRSPSGQGSECEQRLCNLLILQAARMNKHSKQYFHFFPFIS